MTGFVHVFGGGFREGTLEPPRVASAIAYGSRPRWAFRGPSS